MIQPWQFTSIFENHRSILSDCANSINASNADKRKRSRSIEKKATQYLPVWPCKISEHEQAVRFHHANASFNNRDYFRRDKVVFGDYLIPVIEEHELKYYQKGTEKGNVSIGEGLFGKAFIAKFRGRNVVVKKSFEKIKNLDEIEVMCRLNYGDATCKFYGILRGEIFEEICDYILEFIGDENTMKSTTLCSLINEAPKTLSNLEWMNVSSQVCRKLKQIHDVGILHADVKADNILMKPYYRLDTGEISRFEPYFIDFSLSLEEDVNAYPPYPGPNDAEEFEQHHPQIAPELVAGNLFSVQSDIYSIGFTLWVIGLATDIPFLATIGRQLKTTSSPFRPPLNVIADVIDGRVKFELIENEKKASGGRLEI